MTGDTPGQKHNFIMTLSIHFIKLVSPCSVSVVGDKLNTLSIHSPFIAPLLGSLVLQLTKSMPPITVSMAVSMSTPGTQRAFDTSATRAPFVWHPLSLAATGYWLLATGCWPWLAGGRYRRASPGHTANPESSG